MKNLKTIFPLCLLLAGLILTEYKEFTPAVLAAIITMHLL